MKRNSNNDENDDRDRDLKEKIKGTKKMTSKVV